MTSPNARIARSRKRSSREVGVMGRGTEKRKSTVSRRKPRSIKQKVFWSSAKPSIRVQLDSKLLFPNYDKGNVWYTRKDYLDFLLDRVASVEALCGAAEGDFIIEQEKYTLRGLEVFQSTEARADYTSIRKVHQSTILIEQARQSLYGMKNPERFRLMVGPQSELAAKRARDLAIMDEHDVYGHTGGRESLLVTSRMGKSAPNVTRTACEVGVGTKYSTTSLDERIRQLQQANARRLIEIYSLPGYNPFRFPLRRDSLLGVSLADMQPEEGSLLTHSRFGIRRDSLTPVSLRGIL